MLFFFFFSSRRRHTILTCDWSSDVCSSDLCEPVGCHLQAGVDDSLKVTADRLARSGFVALVPDLYHGEVAGHDRSEERRVGKGGRARVAPGRVRKTEREYEKEEPLRPTA